MIRPHEKSCGRTPSHVVQLLKYQRQKELDVRLSDLEDWLTPAEAGRIIGMSKQGVLNYLEDKALRGVKTHQGWLVDPKDAERVRDERAKRKRGVGSGED